MAWLRRRPAHLELNQLAFDILSTQQGQIGIMSAWLELCAVLMADAAAQDADSPEIANVANTMSTGQQSEIDRMQDLLRQRRARAGGGRRRCERSAWQRPLPLPRTVARPPPKRRPAGCSWPLPPVTTASRSSGRCAPRRAAPPWGHHDA